jgi:hypothetical protein
MGDAITIGASFSGSPPLAPLCLLLPFPALRSYMGYRWYDEQGTTPEWPFGHGLSYATFSYSG